MAKQNGANISAYNLLHGFLKLRWLSPEMADWSEERLSSNPPTLLRLRQLVAMSRAFEIPWNPSPFLLGKFIQRESPQYSTLLEKLDSTMPRGQKTGPWAGSLPVTGLL
jgi:hypothetical protein